MAPVAMLPVAMVAAPLAVYLCTQRPTRRDLGFAAACAALAVGACVGRADAFEQIERAWLLLLSGSLAVVLLAGRQRGFVSTALWAVGGAALAGGVLMAVHRLSMAMLVGMAQQHYFLQFRMMLNAFAPVGSATRASYEQSLRTLIGVERNFLPGLVLLQSLAAMALAWGLYHRLARRPQAAPHAPLTAFRFNDHLIWVVALALAVVVLPRVGWAHTMGGNLLVFFGGLYVMRGLAVLVAVATAVGFAGPLAYLTVVLVVLFLLPVVALAALALGLTDTLMDWRRRLARVAHKP